MQKKLLLRKDRYLQKKDNKLLREYPKIANLLDNEVAPGAPDKLSKFRTRNWVKINDNIKDNLLINKLDLKQQC